MRLGLDMPANRLGVVCIGLWGGVGTAEVEHICTATLQLHQQMEAQAAADAVYFLSTSGMAADGAQAQAVQATVLKAYRWQYIVSGAMEPRFQKVLGSLVNAEQLKRIQDALAPLAYAVPAAPEAASAMTH